MSLQGIHFIILQFSGRNSQTKLHIELIFRPISHGRNCTRKRKGQWNSAEINLIAEDNATTGAHIHTRSYTHTFLRIR